MKAINIIIACGVLSTIGCGGSDFTVSDTTNTTGKPIETLAPVKAGIGGAGMGGAGIAGMNTIIASGSAGVAGKLIVPVNAGAAGMDIRIQAGAAPIAGAANIAGTTNATAGVATTDKCTPSTPQAEACKITCFAFSIDTKELRWNYCGNINAYKPVTYWCNFNYYSDATIANQFVKCDTTLQNQGQFRAYCC